MDLVRPEILKQITLRLSSEKGRPVYFAQDNSNGKVFVVTKAVAHALRQLKAAAFGGKDAPRDGMTEETVKLAYGILQVIQKNRLSELNQTKAFNPIFAAIPLVDVGPYQKHLAGVARALSANLVLGAFAVLMCAAVWLGARNDWSIFAAFSNVFSVDALLTFTFVAPFLKIIHELGHVLAATRFGVRVRKGGIYLIGLYPMPFVDCSEADVTARRGHRVMISSAGIVTDIFIGLIAFLLWHVVEGNFYKSLFANIFVFSTLNSVLFNANPLIKMDGYYAISDAIGQRNLSIRAATQLRNFRQWLSSFGAEGGLPKGGSWFVFLYGVVSFFYRIYIMFVIASAILPRYLGVGAVITAWGAVVMFLAPVFRDKAVGQTTTEKKPYRLRKWVFWSGLGGAIALAVIFVRAPFIVVVPMSLDVSNQYQVTVSSSGTLEQISPYAHIRSDDLIARLSNAYVAEQVRAIGSEIEIANQILSSVQGVDPVQTLAASEQVASLGDRLTVLTREMGGLDALASVQGQFVPASLEIGQWIEAGTVIGALYPTEGRAVLVGDFPEAHVDTWTSPLTSAVLRVGRDNFEAVYSDQLELREIMSLDTESGRRSWSIFLSAAASPVDYLGKIADLRLRFAPVPIKDHIAFYWTRTVERFREAQLADRATYLD